MFIGHFGVALAAKRASPQASLGTLFLAAQLLDLMWPPLLLAGVEHVRIAPGITRVTPLDFYDYPISHSLLMVVAWSAVLGIVYFAARKDRRAAFVVGMLVLSHWILDAIVHRPDLPLAPGSDARVGLGLWNSFAGTLLVEGLLFAAGVFLYVRTTSARDAQGRWGLWSLAVFLVVIWLANIFGPVPQNLDQIAYAGLAMWLLVAWAWWADAHRESLS
jgi:FtsH-binding integral membrane protein